MHHPHHKILLLIHQKLVKKKKKKVMKKKKSDWLESRSQLMKELNLNLIMHLIQVKISIHYKLKVNLV
jgi:hypothetical protein